MLNRKGRKTFRRTIVLYMIGWVNSECPIIDFQPIRIGISCSLCHSRQRLLSAMARSMEMTIHEDDRILTGKPNFRDITL